MVYHIKCPRCQASYVGKTNRHLLTRYTEHKNNKGSVKSHFSSFQVPFSLEDISILSSTIKSEEHLLTLEALYIKELSPVLNTQETYKSITLDPIPSLISFFIFAGGFYLLHSITTDASMRQVRQKICKRQLKATPRVYFRFCTSGISRSAPVMSIT